MVTPGARLPTSVIPVHNRLQNTGERCDAYSGRNKNGMLSSEDVTRRSSIRAIDGDLKESDIDC